MELKKEYEKLREEYDLPSFKDINKEFEISVIDLEKVNSFSKAILRVMCSKMSIFLQYVEPVINPSPQGLHAFIEVENTTNDEKKEIFTFYKDLSHKYHKAFALELVEEKDLVIEEIKNIWEYWSTVKNDFKKMGEIIRKSWEREKEKEKVDTIG